MKHFLPVALVALALASCSAPQVRQVDAPPQSAPRSAPVALPVQAPAPERVGPTEAEAAKTRARPYVEGVAALELFRASAGCESPDAGDVLNCIAKLQEDVSLFHRVGSFPQYERNARDWHTSLSFAFAEEALKHDCLDAADKVYRDVMAFYVGATYSGIRDRAKLGIEDVRARRNATSRDSK